MNRLVEAAPFDVIIDEDGTYKVASQKIPYDEATHALPGIIAEGQVDDLNDAANGHLPPVRHIAMDGKLNMPLESPDLEALAKAHVMRHLRALLAVERAARARWQAMQGGPVEIAGSLFHVGDVLRVTLHLADGRSHDEGKAILLASEKLPSGGHRVSLSSDDSVYSVFSEGKSWWRGFHLEKPGS